MRNQAIGPLARGPDHRPSVALASEASSRDRGQWISLRVNLHLSVFEVRRQVQEERARTALTGAKRRLEQRRDQVEQGRHREADDVGEVAADRLDQDRPEALDRVRARPSPPLTGGQIEVDGARVEVAEPDPVRATADRSADTAPGSSTTTPLSTSCSRPERSCKRSRAACSSSGFPSSLPPRTTSVSTPSDDLLRSGGATRDRLAPSVLEHHPLRVAVAELADLGDDELELDPEPLEDLAPAGRG